MESRTLQGGDAVGDADVGETSAFGPLTAEERRRLGRLGGVLFLAGSVFSFPAGLMLEPAPAATSHLLGLAGVITGLALIFAPWERLSARWLHVLILLGIGETVAAVAVFSDDFAFYYVVVAIYAAYIIRDRRVLAGYLALIALALVAPLAYDEGNAREQAHHVLVTLPVFLTAAAVVVNLRETLETRERHYRAFALEAVTLATRIRGTRPRRAEADDADDLDVRLDALAAEADTTLDRTPDRG